MIEGRRNSLNALRLVLASLVIASHAVGFGYFGTEAIAGRTTLGNIAVFGFFGISGYLIASSADHNRVGRFLWRRFLRIMPGFWACLIVMVLVFGLIGFTRAGHHPPGCGAVCYVLHRGVPYFTSDFLLRLHGISTQLGGGWYSIIGGTAVGHGPPVSNYSLWTLFYEFLCYLIMAVLAATGLLRRRHFVLGLTLAVWITEVVVAGHSSPTMEYDAVAMVMLAPVFLSGSLLYLYRDHVPDSGWIAAACTLVFVSGLWLPLGTDARPTAVDVMAPAIAYPMLWLGAHLPLQRVGARHDYSYGMYLYGYPVQMLIASIWAVHAWGYPLYLLACLAATLPFAVASWWIVERTALKLRHVNAPWRPATQRLLSVGVAPDEDLAS